MLPRRHEQEQVLLRECHSIEGTVLSRWKQRRIRRPVRWRLHYHQYGRGDGTVEDQQGPSGETGVRTSFCQDYVTNIVSIVRVGPEG